MNKKKAKILIVADDVDFNRTSGGLVNTKIALVLAQAFDAHLVAAERVPIEIYNAGFQSVRTFSYTNTLFWKILATLPGLRSLPEILTGINHASYHKYQQWKTHLAGWLGDRSFEAVIFLGSGMGWYAHLAYQKLETYPAVVMAQWHDPFPMALLPQPYKAPMNRGQRKLIHKMNLLVEKLDACFLPSKRLLEHLAPYYPGLAQKCTVLPHLAFLPPFLLEGAKNAKPAPNHDWLAWHTENQFLLVHMGSLLEGRSPKGFLEAMRQFLKNFPEAVACTRVVFVGKVHAKLKQEFDAVRQHPCFVVETEKRVSYSQALALQQAASANLIIESDRYPSPQLFGKFADSVLANRPVIALGPEVSEARRLLTSDYSFQASGADVAAIYQLIVTLYAKWKDHHNLQLNRPDLQHYLHPDRLVELVENQLAVGGKFKSATYNQP